MTSKNIKIAVIDSGLNIDLAKKIGSRNLGGYSYKIVSDDIIKLEDYQDNCLHGTACVSIINKFFPHSEFLNIKILNDEGKTNDYILLKSLEDLIETDIKIVNMSLATIKTRNIEGFKKVCYELIKKGKILIASQINIYKGESYPCCLDTVIGVEGRETLEMNYFEFKSKRNIQCIINSSPELTYFSNDDYKFFKGNSKATALLTAKVAEILRYQGDMNYYEMMEKLEHISNENLHSTVCKKRYNAKEIELMFTHRIPEALKNDIYDILCKEIGIDNISYNNLNNIVKEKPLYTNTLYCTNFIKSLKNKWKTNPAYEDISIIDFEDYYTLCLAIYSKWYNYDEQI